jgi:integrase
MTARGRISPDRLKCTLVPDSPEVGNRHGPNHLHRLPSSATLEHGQARRSKGAAAAERDLGNSHTPAARRKDSELALFNLAVDSKLRSCDLVTLRARDVTHGERVATRAIAMQQKTQRPVQFEITEQTRESIAAWIRHRGLTQDDFLFPSRLRASPHLSTHQYARVVRSWVKESRLDPAAYGTHTLRRTKASVIYRRTKNLRAVQLLLGHTKLESTVRYLGIEVDDALEMAEQTEV